MSETGYPEVIPSEERPAVEPVNSSYRPSEAELGKKLPSLDLPGDSPMEKFQHALNVLTQPANVTFLRRPKRRD